jgi:nitrite reductase/ring-hydroxylating ferredoxin subunit
MKLPFAILCLFLALALTLTHVNSFSLVMMAARKGRGNLKKSLQGESVSKKKNANPTNALNQGKGQEITGVTLPAEGAMKGWEFGDKVTMVCANVGGRFYAVQGDCPRCAFDLWKGDLIADDPAFENLPRVACPTCATTFSLASGKYGPQLKRTGLAGFVGGLTNTATAGDKPADAKAFQITLEEDGRVYCRDKQTR